MRVLHDGLSFQDFTDFTFIYCLACVVEFELVSATTHPEDLEAVDLWNESGRGHHLVIEMLKRTEIQSLL